MLMTIKIINTINDDKISPTHLPMEFENQTCQERRNLGEPRRETQVKYQGRRRDMLCSLASNSMKHK